jgi:hypothetical protein
MSKILNKPLYLPQEPHSEVRYVVVEADLLKAMADNILRVDELERKVSELNEAIGRKGVRK